MSNLSSAAAGWLAPTKLGDKRSWKDCCVVKNTFLDILDHEDDGFHTLRRHASEPHCGLSNGARRDGAGSSYSSFDAGDQTNEASQHSPQNSCIFNLDVPLGPSSSMQPKPEVLSGASSCSSMQAQPISDVRAWELRDPTKAAGASSSWMQPKKPTSDAASSAGATLYISEGSSAMQSKSTSDDHSWDLLDPTTDMSRIWEPAWSVGAALHSTGDCKPCPWAYKPRGCSSGEMCDKCHLCNQEAYKQYRKNRLAGLKASRLKRKNKNAGEFKGDISPNPCKFSL